jgi:hypothetical protein
MSPHRTRAITAVLGAAAVMAAAPVHSEPWELKGTKTITAHTRDQQHIRIGRVRFDPLADGSVAFVITMDSARFGDHFLSMKEFKCLDGRGELVCHVPYPYRQPGAITATNFAWLEHGLLFLYKLPADFGAKLWNGLYFRFERGAQGLVGLPQAIDLNRISAPPDQPGLPPFRAALRDDIAPGSRWIESLSIE